MTRSSSPASTSACSRPESVGLGMPRFRTNSPYRRTPKSASRRIISVQWSTIRASARLTEVTAWKSVCQIGRAAGARHRYAITSRVNVASGRFPGRILGRARDDSDMVGAGFAVGAEAPRNLPGRAQRPHQSQQLKRDRRGQFGPALP